jgi:D-alanine-D-alanine ligase-like ATP-grasp enzyme
MLVVGQQDVYVIRKTEPSITGDGIATMHELLETRNKDVLKKYGEDKVIEWSDVDDLMQAGGHKAGSVLGVGEVVPLHMHKNFDKKRISENITNIVSDQLREVSIQIAQKMKMDVIGIDIMSKDATKGGVEFCVLEMNSNPGLRGHVEPPLGEPIHIGEKILQYMFGK